MVGTALLIAAGLVIVGCCLLALKSHLRRRREEAPLSSDGAVRERAETLQQLARDMDKENVSRARLDVLSVFGQ